MKKNVKVLVFAALLCSALLYGCSTTANDTKPPKISVDSGHNHTEVINIVLKSPITTKLSLNEEFNVNIQEHNKPLSKASVGFEFWKEGDTNHQFIEALETQEGHYSAKIAFPQAGTYTVKIHVEKGDHIHEHKEIFITVE